MVDISSYRDKLLSDVKFQPREVDIDTPYLVFSDGDTLDGKLKVRGMSGQEGLDLRKACTITRPGPNGTTISEWDNGKLAAKTTIKCLYWRTVDGKTGEVLAGGNTPVFLPTDDTAFLALGQHIVNELGGQVMTVVGMDASVESAKKNLEGSLNDDSTSNSLASSEEPSLNSSHP